MAPVSWQDLIDWLDTQWGPGTRFPEKLDLARAIGSKSALDQIRGDGVTTMRKAQAIARATGVSPLFILVKAGVVTTEDISEFCEAPLTSEEAEWIHQIRLIQAAAPVRYEILRDIRQAAFHRSQPT